MSIRRHRQMAQFKPIEVSCGGFTGRSLYRPLGFLGNRELQERRANKNIFKAAKKQIVDFNVQVGHEGA